MIKDILFLPFKLSKYINGVIDQRNELKKIIISNQKYLMPGKYKITGIRGKKIAYLRNHMTIQFIRKKRHIVRANQNYLKRIIRDIVGRLLAISNTKVSDQGQGSLIMITRNNDIRIFDFVQNKILVLLSNEDKFWMLYNNYKKFSRYFLIPRIQFDTVGLKYTEEYLDFKPFELWNKKEKGGVLWNIFTIYKKYYRDINKKYKINNSTTEQLFFEFEKNVKHKKLVSLVNDILSRAIDNVNYWPLMTQHGDLGYYNILLYNEKCYFIDWEDSDQYIFYYDIFNYFYTSKNIGYYFEGLIDDELDVLFSIFNLDYNRNNKLYYFIIFLMQRLTWEVKINLLPDAILNRACTIIKSNM